MKIHFDASVSGKKIFSENYRAIYNALLQSGHKVSTFTFDSSPESIAKETIEEAEAFYRKLENAIRKNDIGFFEVSYPSLGIGYEIARFSELSKPVVAMHVRGKRPYVLESMARDKFQVVEYEISEVDGLVDDLVSSVLEHLDARFTMLMQPKFVKHLNKIVKSGISRSDYIRNLIEKDMKKKK